MKVKTLIEKLQDFDPDLEVCIGNADIHFVSKQPAYWDGYLQVLERDESITEYYNIIGAEYSQNDDKVSIHTLSIRSAIWNDPDMPVECYNKEQEEMVAEWRKEVKDFDKELDKEEE